jgi:hypothetical protein
MINLIIGSTATFAVAKIYLKKNDVNIGINNNVLALILTIIVVIFLSLIQVGFDFLLNIFIRG